MLKHNVDIDKGDNQSKINEIRNLKNMHELNVIEIEKKNNSIKNK